MTARREASTPPRLPGYEYLRVLGLGGFADVFLYQQELPRREVAVKVLLAGSLDDEVRRRFQQEANLMAQLSHHPSIVTIYHAAIAADGRPFLVMEYCSRPGLAERYRQERISVAESLRIGIRLASAVETAHRAGILHRDIKPANVLTTDFGWPALTDFGIAATTGHGGGATVGMSIPWSPPELLGEHPTGDERSDVYSLAATIYSLLAGRTPFEVPGGQNTAQQLVARIERAPLPPTGRDDVPAGLHELLDRAMAKHPARRFASAAAVARALQQVEADLRLPITPLDLMDGGDADLTEVAPPTQQPWPEEDRDDATRLRSIITVAPSAPAAPVPDPTPPGASEPTRLRGVTYVAPEAPSAPPVVVTPAEVEAAEPETAQRGRARVVAGVVSGLVVLAAVVAIGAAALRDDSPGDEPTTTSDFTQDAPTRIADAVPSPSGLQGARQADGSVVFTWDNPDPLEGDRYLWGVLQATGETESAVVDALTVTVPAEQATTAQVCIEVAIVRADRRVSAEPAQGCTS